MIRAISNTDGPPVTFESIVAGLAIYLDNWAVIDLAEGDPSRRIRFIQSLRVGGDLLFSVTNAAELAGQKGCSVDAVRTFLDEVGPHWFPVELEPIKVVRREQKGANWSESCIAHDFIQAYFSNRTAGYSASSRKIIDLSRDFFSLGAVVDWVTKSQSLPKLSQEFDGLLKTSAGKRPANKRTRAWLDQNYPAQPFNPQTPATFVFHNLLRTVILESGQLKRGDGLDFCHTVIASAFASVAALDKHWKKRIEGLPKPNKLARMYSGPELDNMVTDIESWVNSNQHLLVGRCGLR
jgi:hypothetical protein